MATARPIETPADSQYREDAIVPDLDLWIGGLFDDDHLDATAEALAAASGTAPDGNQHRDLELRRRLAECDAKLTKYRALLEHESDITIVATWIAETERERRNLERDLGRNPPPANSPRKKSRRSSSNCVTS